MKVKELRIGNILDNGHNIVQVTSISLDIDDEYNPAIGVCKRGEHRNEVIVNEAAFGIEVKPIPLTPEWLERCGLTQKPLEPDGLPQWSNLNMNIAQYTDGFYLYTITSDPWHDQAVGKKIEFVHTLQNISLDLFGEELNVKL